MSGPQNAVMGEGDSPVDLPQTQVPVSVLTEEMQMASYSQSSEYKRLKEFLEDRLKFYQRYMPDGRRIQDLSKEQRDEHWAAACIVIGEIEGILEAYKQAHESVKQGAGRES